MKVAEIKMVRWMCEHTRINRIRNKVIQDRRGACGGQDAGSET